MRERVVTQLSPIGHIVLIPFHEEEGEHEVKRNKKNEERDVVWEKNEKRERPCHFGHDKQMGKSVKDKLRREGGHISSRKCICFFCFVCVFVVDCLLAIVHGHMFRTLCL